MRPVPLDRICAATAALCTFSISEPPVLEGCGCSRSSLAWRMDKQGFPHPGSDGSEEEPMSSAPPSDDEFPIQDDETLSELVRTPSRTSGDLQQHADLEDDLEPVPDFEERAPTNQEMLAELLQRVRRIEEHLGIHES